jgi:hypothetical protein
MLLSSYNQDFVMKKLFVFIAFALILLLYALAVSSPTIKAVSHKPSAPKRFSNLIHIPAGVAITPQGNLYLLDSRSGLVKYFNHKARCLHSFRVVKPDREDRRYWHQALALAPDGSLLVMDHERGTIFRYSTLGKRLKTFSAFNNTKEYELTSALAVGADGSIYVAFDPDYGQASILRKFTPAGKKIWQLVLPSEHRNSSVQLGALAMSPSGKLQVWLQSIRGSEGKDWGRVIQVDPAGSFRVREPNIKADELPGWLQAAAFDDIGGWCEAWFETAAGTGTTLIRYAPSGKRLWERTFTAVEVTGLVLAADGTIFLALRDYKFYAPVCLQISKTGKTIKTIGTTGHIPWTTRTYPLINN